MLELIIKLTDAEEALASRIEFDALKIKGNHGEVLAILHAARDLARSLVKRNAIPEHRRRFFEDPEYNINGHGSSRKEIMERNAGGKDILTSPRFLKHLHYFVYGPNLPPAVIDGFAEAVKKCFWKVTSGDIIPLGNTAKQLALKHGLDMSVAAEEFYKLALEHGLQHYEAREIRDRVNKAK